MMIVSAFPVAGGIQVNRQIDETTLTAAMVFPDSPGWAEAQAAAGWFEQPDTPPIETPEQMLAARRAAASMSRIDFVLAAVASGLMTAEEAPAAARGDIPASLAPTLAALPPAEQLEAAVRWAGATVIARNEPMLALIATAFSVTDAQLDALFSIPAPEVQP